MSDKHASRQEAKAEMPVISMDFCFSRGDEEVDVEVKQDLRIYQGDLYSVCADSRERQGPLEVHG